MGVTLQDAATAGAKAVIAELLGGGEVAKAESKEIAEPLPENMVAAGDPVLKAMEAGDQHAALEAAHGDPLEAEQSVMKAVAAQMGQAVRHHLSRRP
jgi:hypothetical protein